MMIVKAALFSALVGGYLPSAQSFVPSTSAGRYSVPSLLMSEGSSSAPKNSQAMMNQGFFGAQDEVQVDSTTFDASLSHLAHLGDYGETADVDSLSSEERRKHNLNVGKALDTLQRQLPYMFAMTNLDFSIFANLITLNDEKRNKFVMQRTLYSAAVRSMCMASRFSSIYPSLNLKNIEYIESESVIQCLVDVVLPDSVRVDGQAVWEGIFYFGLDREGFISSHTFDRKVPTMGNKRPLLAGAAQYPWLQSSSAQGEWTPDLLVGALSTSVSRPTRTLSGAAERDDWEVMCLQ